MAFEPHAEAAPRGGFSILEASVCVDAPRTRNTRSTDMSFKDPGFGDRLASAANAKKAAFDKFRSKPAPDDPAVLKRQEERAAIQAAREERARAREAARIKAEEEAR